MDIFLESEIHKRFKLLRYLGGGRSNHVFLVQDRQVPETDVCVLKCLKYEYLNNCEVRQTIEDEGKILCLMDHDYIMKGLEYGVCGNTPYLLSKLIKGKHLNPKKCSEEHDNPYFVLHLVLQVLDVLVYFTTVFENECDGGSVVHGDFGLHNILITKNVNIRIVDFENSQIYCADQPGEIMDQSNQHAGKMNYFTAFCPPEALIRKDPLVDIYSAGAIIFTLLTGKNLRMANKEPVTSSGIAITEPSNIDALPLTSKVNYMLMKIAQKATAFDREKRYQNARVFQAELQNIATTCQQQMISAVNRRKPPQPGEKQKML